MSASSRHSAITWRFLFVVVVLIALIASIDAARIRGTKPGDSRYNPLPATTFECFDKSKQIPVDQVNDNYCDCPDGSDEPGTSACPNGKFYCVNRYYIGKEIPSSKVNDGICDCCDGSDEADVNDKTSSTCPNTCKELGQQMHMGTHEKIKTIKEGLALREQRAAECQAELDKLTKERDEIKKKLSAETSALQALQAEKERLEKLEEFEKNVLAAQQEEERAREKAEREMLRQQQDQQADEQAQEQQQQQQQEVQKQQLPQTTEGTTPKATTAGTAAPSQEGLKAATPEATATETAASEASQDQNTPEHNKEVEIRWDEKGNQIVVEKNVEEGEAAQSENGEETQAEGGEEEDLEEEHLEAIQQQQQQQEGGEAETTPEEEAREQARREALANFKTPVHALVKNLKASKQPQQRQSPPPPPPPLSSSTPPPTSSGSGETATPTSTPPTPTPTTPSSGRPQQHTPSASAKSYSDAGDDEPLPMVILSYITAPFYYLHGLFNYYVVAPLYPAYVDTIRFFYGHFNKTEAEIARDQYTQKKREVEQLEKKLKDLDKALELDYGPHKEFYYMKRDKLCLQIDTREYVYEVCPFENAQQKDKKGGGSTNLGKWKGFENNYTAMKFDSGTSCWNGPQRSTKVSLVCGTKDEIKSVEEPSRCVYTMVMSTPSVCSAEELQSLEAIVKQQHEAPEHDQE